MVQKSACNAQDPGLIPGLGRSPGKGNGNPLHCSCLENFMDRGACWAAFIGLHRVIHDWVTNTSLNTWLLEENRTVLYVPSVLL